MFTSERQTKGVSEGMRRVVSATGDVAEMEVDSSADEHARYNDSAMMIDYDNVEELSAGDHIDNLAVPIRFTEMRRSISSGSSLSDGSAGLIPDGTSTQEEVMAEPTGQSYRFENIVESTGGQLSSSRDKFVNLQAQRQSGRSGGTNRMDDSATGSSGSFRARSENSSNDWGYGWYEDVHGSENMAQKSSDKRSAKRPGLVPRAPSTGEVDDNGPKDAGAMAVTAPTYVLEESLSSQHLWKYTAGQRPPQPVEERAFYEKMWAQNFARSQVNYSMPAEVLTAASPISLSPFADGLFDGPNLRDDYASAVVQPQVADQGAAAEATLVSLMNDPNQRGDDSGVLPKTIRGHGSHGDLTILVRGLNAFGTTVSKSFARPAEKGGGIVTINISIASYRVVESNNGHKYAQFLVIYREGSIQDTVGVWKRYRDFEELAKKVTNSHEGCAAVIATVSPLSVTEEPEIEHLPNAITSWRLLKKRQRWFRCLDAGYLSLKVFLLERFLHDILFESTSPKLLQEFVGTASNEST